MSYDDPLRKLLPEFPSWGDTVTLRRLLHHTAGLPEYEELFVQSGRVDRDWPRSARGQASAFEPTARTAAQVEVNYVGRYFLDASNRGGRVIQA